MSYTEKLRKQFPQILEASCCPKFLQDLEKGTLPVDKFRTYIIQRYVIGRSFKKFVGVLTAKFPEYFERATNQAAAEILGKVIANIKPEEKFKKFCQELKIAEAEIQPNLVAKGFSDYLLMIAYNQGYKEALVVAVAMKMVYEKNKNIYGKGGDNPLYKEALQHPDQVVIDFLDWAENTLNLVMKDVKEVTPKHLSVLKYTLQWEATILQGASEPQKWNWPVQA